MFWGFSSLILLQLNFEWKIYPQNWYNQGKFYIYFINP